MKAKLNGR